MEELLELRWDQTVSAERTENLTEIRSNIKKRLNNFGNEYTNIGKEDNVQQKKNKVFSPIFVLKFH